MSPPRPILIAGPTASGKSGAGAVRWPSGSAAPSSTPTACRCTGNCACSRPGLRARRRRARRTRSTASCPGPRPTRPGAMQRTRQQRSRRRVLLAACPSSWAAPASTSARCCRACRRCRRWSPRRVPTGAARLHRRPASELHALLQARDPETAARLMPTDPQRIVRALEVLESTGRSLSRLAARAGCSRCCRRRRRCGSSCCRSARRLAARIEARFDAMIAGGALQEVAGLAGARSLPGAADHAGAGGGAAGGPSGRGNDAWRRPSPSPRPTPASTPSGSSHGCGEI